MKLNNERAEKFCELYVKGGLSPSEACFKAGYGGEAHGHKRDGYHSAQANKLMHRKDICIRIEELKEELANEHQADKLDIVSTLMYGLMHDTTRHMKVYTGVTKDGLQVQSVIIDPKDSDFTLWDLRERQLIDHFDPKTGNPVFISKTYCLDKLLKIMKLDEDNTETEDLASLLSNAGLIVGKRISEEDNG